jgi:hypothetical protein
MPLVNFRKIFYKYLKVQSLLLCLLQVLKSTVCTSLSGTVPSDEKVCTGTVHARVSSTKAKTL